MHFVGFASRTFVLSSLRLRVHEATAADEGDDELNARQAYLAYRHQLNAVQYAEIAVMDNESFEDEPEQEAT